MLRAALILLSVAWCAPGQDTRPAKPAPPPLAVGSQESLRLLTAAVSKTRIVDRVRDACTAGGAESRRAEDASSWISGHLVRAGLTAAAGAPSRAAGRVTASVDPRDGVKRLLVAAPLWDNPARVGAHESAAGAAAFVETALILRASRETGQLAELPFEARFEAAPAAALGREEKAGSVVAEIVFGPLGHGAARDTLFVTVAAEDAARDALVAKLTGVLKGWSGVRGFWRDFEILADPASPPAHGAPRVTIACTAPAGARVLGSASESRSSGDVCPVAGTPDDVPDRTVVVEPNNAVHAVRFALLLIAQLAHEQASR